MKRIFLLTVFFMITNISAILAQNVAHWQTSLGDFKVELREDLVPITANNFADLALSNFYDNLIFHRVIDDFMIQDGCPLGTGYGGPGYTIEDEFHPDLNHNSAGIISMANTGQPNSAGSQYFITLAPQPSLNGSYAVFGEVIEGLDIVQDIGDVATNSNDKPLVDVNIYSITMLGMRITENIADLQLMTSTHEINLDNHYEIYSGNQAAYSASSTNSNIVDTSLNGNLLTLTRGSETGEVTITVEAVDGEYSREIVFGVAVFDAVPIAGFGNMFNADGENDYINCGDNDILDDLNELTVSFWMNLNDNTYDQGIIGKSANLNGWYFQYRAPGTNRILKFNLRKEGGQIKYLYTASQLDANTWYHITGTYDGIDMKIYVNGELDSLNNTGASSGITNADCNLEIGRQGSAYLNGAMDNISIWNYAMEENEVKSQMIRVLNGSENGLLGTWAFDESYGSNTSDATGLNNGTLINTENSVWQTSTAPINFSFGQNGPNYGILPANNLTDDYEFIIEANPSHGTLDLFAVNAGHFIYTPENNYLGDDSFQYKIYDGAEFYSETIEAGITVSDQVDIEGNYQLSIVNYQLKQNYPNPFNPVTKIRYHLPVETMHASSLRSAEIVVYNAMGQSVWSTPVGAKNLLPGTATTNNNGSIIFDGSKFNSGIYYYSLIVDGKKIDTKTMVLIK